MTTTRHPVVEQHLFELAQAQPEPYSCTGGPHRHRWLRFGRNGEREELIVADIDGAGQITISEQAFEVLARAAGFVLADPDRVEVEARKRLSWARSRMQDYLNRRNR